MSKRTTGTAIFPSPTDAARAAAAAAHASARPATIADHRKGAAKFFDVTVQVVNFAVESFRNLARILAKPGKATRDPDRPDLCTVGEPVPRFALKPKRGRGYRPGPRRVPLTRCPGSGIMKSDGMVADDPARQGLL